MKRNIPSDLHLFTPSVMYPFIGVSDDFRVINWRTNSLLKPIKDTYGYLSFNVRCDGVNKRALFHRVVAEKALGLPFNYQDLCVNHKDGNKSNNDPLNLEWVTLVENNKHANLTGLRDSCKGVFHHGCKTHELTVHKACGYMSLHLSNKEVDTLLGLPAGFCNDIRRGRRWKEISSEYNIPVKVNKSCIFYIMKLGDNYIKYGVTNNLNRRLIETRYNSKPFKVQLIYTKKFCVSVNTKDIENLIKGSSTVNSKVLDKNQLPLGFTEVCALEDAAEIIGIVENYKPT